MIITAAPATKAARIKNARHVLLEGKGASVGSAGWACSSVDWRLFRFRAMDLAPGFFATTGILATIPRRQLPTVGLI
jgi:hypothetical protein